LLDPEEVRLCAAKETATSGVRRRHYEPYPGDGHPGSADRGPVALAERILRAGDQFDPTRPFGPRDCLGRAPSSSLLRCYADYYNQSRTHLSLNKDAPTRRPVHIGSIEASPVLGGLHHHYVRI
jgi:hypothetical protein